MALDFKKKYLFAVGGQPRYLNPKLYSGLYRNLLYNFSGMGTNMALSSGNAPVQCGLELGM